jgi:hypothetical protein
VMISHNALSASSWAATHSSYDPSLRTGLLPLPLSHVYGLMVSAMALHAPDPGHDCAHALVRPCGLADAGRRAPGAGQPGGAVDARDPAAAAAGGLRPVRAAPARPPAGRRCRRRSGPSSSAGSRASR